MKKLVFIVTILLFIVGCSQEECTKDDQKVIEQVIIDYFKAISNSDFEEIHNLSTSDFVLYEDGLIWNNDSLIKMIKKYKELFPDADMSYNLKNFNTKLDCNSARTMYTNFGQMETHDTIIEFNWIESATFTKIDEAWKLEFLHSTVKK